MTRSLHGSVAAAGKCREGEREKERRERREKGGLERARGEFFICLLAQK